MLLQGERVVDLSQSSAPQNAEMQCKIMYSNTWILLMLLLKCYPLFRDFLDCFSLVREYWRSELWHFLNLYKCSFIVDQITSWIYTRTPGNSSFAGFPSHSPSALLNICIEITFPALSPHSAFETPLYTPLDCMGQELHKV